MKVASVASGSAGRVLAVGRAGVEGLVLVRGELVTASVGDRTGSRVALVVDGAVVVVRLEVTLVLFALIRGRPPARGQLLLIAEVNGLATVASTVQWTKLNRTSRRSDKCSNKEFH